MKASLIVTFLATVTLVPAQNDKKPGTESKNPPAGAPWSKNFGEAQRMARKAGRPIFVYSTKTY